MMYFIQNLQTYSPKNRKCIALLKYVASFENVLIKDQVSLDALVEELRIKVDEINAEFPKQKEIHYSAGDLGAGEFRIDASMNNMGCPDTIFIMTICKVSRLYQFSGTVGTHNKEIATPGVCRICGCTENDPCLNPGVGTCWWADEEHTLCSHCANPDIKDDPKTIHCVNSRKGM